jgi:hypothetical protein
VGVGEEFLEREGFHPISGFQGEKLDFSTLPHFVTYLNLENLCLSSIFFLHGQRCGLSSRPVTLRELHESRAVSSVVEHLTDTEGVTSSNLVSRTM